MSKKFTKEQRLQRALFQLIDGMFKHQYDIFYYQELLAIANLKRNHLGLSSNIDEGYSCISQFVLLPQKINASIVKLNRCKQAYANLIAKVVEEMSK